MENEIYVSISLTEYSQLMASEEKLQVLINHGVDNWDGYSEAMIEYQKGNEDEKD